MLFFLFNFDIGKLGGNLFCDWTNFYVSQEDWSLADWDNLWFLNGNLFLGFDIFSFCYRKHEKLRKFYVWIYLSFLETKKANVIIVFWLFAHAHAQQAQAPAGITFEWAESALPGCSFWVRPGLETFGIFKSWINSFITCEDNWWAHASVHMWYLATCWQYLKNSQCSIVWYWLFGLKVQLFH